MQINQRFGQTMIFVFLSALVFGGSVYSVWTWWEDARLPKLTESEIGEMVFIGMNEKDVTEALGSPKDRIESENGSGWIYHNNPPFGSPTRIFIMFREGKVTEVILKTPKLHSMQTNAANKVRGRQVVLR